MIVSGDWSTLNSLNCTNLQGLDLLSDQKSQTQKKKIKDILRSV